MASVVRDPGGRRRILFVAPDGKRKPIRLGKVSERMAEAVCVRVEALVAAKLTGHAPDDEVSRWVANLSDTLAGKLAAVGLIPPRDSTTLAAFLDDYIAQRADTKASTRTVYGHTRRCLVEFFGADKPLGEITPGDGDSWRLWLVTHEELADNTVRRAAPVSPSSSFAWRSGGG